MISKIIILAIALGITVPVALEKGIQDTMDDPARIEEYQEYKEVEQEIIAREESIARAEEELTTIQKLYIEMEGKAPVECKAILNEYGIQFEEAECPKNNVECEVSPCCHVDICLRVEDDDEELHIGYKGISYNRFGGSYHDRVHIWTEYDMFDIGWPGTPGYERYEGNSHKDQMIYLNRMEFQQ